MRHACSWSGAASPARYGPPSAVHDRRPWLALALARLRWGRRRLVPRAGGEPRGGRARRAAPARTGVRVPQIAGVEIDHARHRAERVGLTLAVSGYVGKYGNGRYNVRCVKVLRQSPVAGERLAKGSAVYVILKECRTPKTAPVPPAGTT